MRNNHIPWLSYKVNEIFPVFLYKHPHWPSCLCLCQIHHLSFGSKAIVPIFCYGWVSQALWCFLFLSVCWYFLARWCFNYLQYSRSHFVTGACTNTAPNLWSMFLWFSWHIPKAELFWENEGKPVKVAVSLLQPRTRDSQRAKALHQKHRQHFQQERHSSNPQFTEFSRKGVGKETLD